MCIRDSFQRFFATGRRVSLTTFSRTQSWLAVAALSSLVLFHWIAAIIPPVLRATHQTFSGLLLAQFITTALTVLPVATIFGFNFPAVIVLLGGATRSTSGNSATVGHAYAANTFGAIVGSLLTGFCLLPWLCLLYTSRCV